MQRISSCFGSGADVLLLRLIVRGEQVSALDYVLMPVLQSFAHMVRFDSIAMLQISNCT